MVTFATSHKGILWLLVSISKVPLLNTGRFQAIYSIRYNLEGPPFLTCYIYTEPVSYKNIGQFLFKKVFHPLTVRHM